MHRNIIIGYTIFLIYQLQSFIFSCLQSKEDYNFKPILKFQKFIPKDFTTVKATPRVVGFDLKTLYDYTISAKRVIM